MFDIGMPELIVIFIVALLVFGPKRLPELAKAAGKGLAELKKSLHDVKRQVETEFKESTTDIQEAVKGIDKGTIGEGLIDFKKSLQDIKKQVESGYREAINTSADRQPVMDIEEEAAEEEGEEEKKEEEKQKEKEEKKKEGIDERN
ncbi:MAG TPA: Sec-independent protein translocase protein TatB [Thermodesulfovibrionales bacterium]|nr:Sec-independent protein translocase protein TatB [Thermodesulfovibrionales bacterium]